MRDRGVRLEIEAVELHGSSSSFAAATAVTGWKAKTMFSQRILMRIIRKRRRRRRKQMKKW